jgi:tetratricopeptide (TPR) repeat protein
LPPGSRLPFARNQLFTGRVAPLKGLARALLQEAGPATLVTQAVTGMGGVGKTQLAVEFAHRYGRFFHGVYWVNAREPDAIMGEIAACGVAMLLPAWPDELPEQVTWTLDAWRRGSASRLVILDNLEDVEAAREWLGKLSGGPVRVLLAARRGDWPRDIGLASLSLDMFTPGESRTFLREYLDEDRALDEELDELADRLGHLPLALELAGRYLERRRLTVSEYAERLKRVLDDPSMLGWNPAWGNPTQHDLDLRATFALSWEQVTDEAARRVFLAAGYCAPNEPILCEILEAAAGLDQESCDEAQGTLKDLGLVEWERFEAGPTIHPLLAEYARAQEGAGEVLPGLAQALARLSEAANDEMDREGHRAQFEPLWSHVRAVADWAQGGAEETAASLMINLGCHLKGLADYAGAKPYFERALAIREKVLGAEHPTTAISLNNLGALLQDLGDLAGAKPYYERALAITEKVSGAEHPTTAISLNNLGSLLHSMGDLAGARPYLERALAINEKVLGAEHPDTASSLNNLGSLLYSMRDLAGARPYLERALAIREKVLGAEHPTTASSFNNLGALLQDMGDLAGAKPYYERALVIYEKVLGAEHPTTASSLNNLGSLLQDMGDLAGAKPYLERAQAIWEEVLGAEHPDTALSLNNLGSVLHAMGDLAGAKPYFERALAIFKKRLPPDHPNIQTVASNLAALEQQMNNEETQQP